MEQKRPSQTRPRLSSLNLACLSRSWDVPLFRLSLAFRLSAMEVHHILVYNAIHMHVLLCRLTQVCIRYS